MNFVPVLIANLILLVITILLAIADKLLVTYGECKITIKSEDEQKELLVEGGNNLLSYLIDNNVEISSSCGGKGTCGYCKVRVTEGGGQILPTEEIFMSRQERNEMMRLACQVKVKNDLVITIPDFLSVVREMVENQKFDPNKRWRVTVT
jgi:Na+-transporting NADH:ubiquinone oxidoreductase subunit F